MKMKTMLEYMQKELVPVIEEGWESKASFEVAVQVRLDKIVRMHLSSRIALASDDKDKKELLQTSGKGATVAKDIATGAVTVPKGVARFDQIATKAWDKMREINYTGTTMIADMYLANNRFVAKPGDLNSLSLKSTYYWIELKIESPATHKFGGFSLKQAILFDKDKLVKQKGKDPVAKQGERRRYWYFIIAISDDERNKLKKFSDEHAGQPQIHNIIDPAMSIGYVEV